MSGMDRDASGPWVIDDVRALMVAAFAATKASNVMSAAAREMFLAAMRQAMADDDAESR